MKANGGRPAQPGWSGSPDSAGNFGLDFENLLTHLSVNTDEKKNARANTSAYFHGLEWQEHSSVICVSLKRNIGWSS